MSEEQQTKMVEAGPTTYLDFYNVMPLVERNYFLTAAPKETPYEVLPSQKVSLTIRPTEGYRPLLKQKNCSLLRFGTATMQRFAVTGSSGNWYTNREKLSTTHCYLTCTGI